jgi:hypothetical protein
MDHDYAQMGKDCASLENLDALWANFGALRVAPDAFRGVVGAFLGDLGAWRVRLDEGKPSFGAWAAREIRGALWVQHGGRWAKHAGTRLGRRDVAQASRWHGLLLVVLLRFLGEYGCVAGMFVGLLEAGVEVFRQRE